MQDIHWSADTSIKVKEEWGSNIIISPNTTQARGTAILINNIFECDLGGNIIDPGGNYSMIELILPTGLKIVLASIYGPNQDTPQFYKEISNHLASFENPTILIGGDWNCTRDFKIDNLNYVAVNNPKSVQEIDQLCRKHNLNDVWRIYNPSKNKFTWSQGISNKKARLDYFLCNEELLSIIKKPKIGTKYRSDHAPISLRFNDNSITLLGNPVSYVKRNHN